MKTYDQLAHEAAQAFKTYFHERRHTAETLHQLEESARAMEDRYNVFIQVRRMGSPDAALVIYGSAEAWRQHREPVTIIPFASI
jgi:hypothetical protein